jgi:oxygen-dependent protoporphyrinogen oxidase
VTDVRVAIVGGGITGLATAAWLEHDHGFTNVAVLEASDRAGGKIRTQIDAGHCLEWGPQGFLDNAPDTLELVRFMGLGDALVQADDASADRFIVRGGKPRRVPMSPVSFLASDVLPLYGRLRVLAEPFARGRPPVDETVFEFARRRIGRSAAEVLVDAMVTGVFAGDSRQLSLAATFPRMAAMEAQYGSLTRALLARMRQARQQGERGGGPAGPGGTLTSFHGGMELLPATLARHLGQRLRLQSCVTSLGANPGGFNLTVSDSPVTADAIVLTTAADDTAQLVQEVAPAAVEPLHEIRTAPIAVVMTCYRDESEFRGPVRGFGFLVPGTEPLGILGTLFCHSIFTGQAPAGSVFLRTMVGGARDPAAVELDDDALLGRTRSALGAVLGADPDPDLTWIVRWVDGITQYTVGHLARVEQIESATRAAGVEVAGSPYRGVSVNDCIRQARMVARRVVERLAGRRI